MTPSGIVRPGGSNPYTSSAPGAARGVGALGTGTYGVTYNNGTYGVTANGGGLSGGLGTGTYGGDSGYGFAAGGSVGTPDEYGDPERVLLGMLDEYAPGEAFDAYTPAAPDLGNYRRDIASAMLAGDPEGAKSLRSMAKRYADMFKKE